MAAPTGLCCNSIVTASCEISLADRDVPINIIRSRQQR
jgi:hypothetical protein